MLAQKLMTQIIMMKSVKIRFNSDDDSPLDKTLELSNMLMVIKYVFHEGSKFNPHYFLDEFL